MKKFLLTMAAIVTLSLVSCEHSHKYKAEGERMANRLDELCEKQDAAAIAMEDSIRSLEQELIVAGDTVDINDFHNAVVASMKRNAPAITRMKVQAGTSTDEAVNPLIEDVLNGNGDIDITTVTKAINEGIKAQKEKK